MYAVSTKLPSGNYLLLIHTRDFKKRLQRALLYYSKSAKHAKIKFERWRVHKKLIWLVILHVITHYKSLSLHHHVMVL